MPEKRNRQRVPSFPDEETWLRSFVGFHGTDGVIRFGGVSLVRIIEALLCGEVVASEKCDGPGAVCIVEHHREEDAALVSVRVHFVSNEEELTILEAAVVRELGNGSDHAA